MTPARERELKLKLRALVAEHGATTPEQVYQLARQAEVLTEAEWDELAWRASLAAAGADDEDAS